MVETPVDGHRERTRQRAVAQREHEQVRRARRAPQQVLDELQRRVVGPVEVVEDQRGRPLAREQLDQRAQRAVVAEALGGGVGRPDRRRAARRGREHRAQHAARAPRPASDAASPRGRPTRPPPARTAPRARAPPPVPAGSAARSPPPARPLPRAAPSCRSPVHPRRRARATRPRGRPRSPAPTRRAASHAQQASHQPPDAGAAYSRALVRTPLRNGRLRPRHAHVPGRPSADGRGKAPVSRATADGPLSGGEDVGRAGALEVGGAVVGLLLRAALGGDALRGRARPRGRSSPRPSRAARPSAAPPARAASRPRSQVSIEIRVRRASTSSRCSAPSWVAA